MSAGDSGYPDDQPWTGPQYEAADDGSWDSVGSSSDELLDFGLSDGSDTSSESSDSSSDGSGFFEDESSDSSSRVSDSSTDGSGSGYQPDAPWHTPQTEASDDNIDWEEIATPDEDSNGSSNGGDGDSGDNGSETTWGSLSDREKLKIVGGVALIGAGVLQL